MRLVLRRLATVDRVRSNNLEHTILKGVLSSPAGAVMAMFTRRIFKFTTNFGYVIPYLQLPMYTHLNVTLQIAKLYTVIMTSKPARGLHRAKQTGPLCNSKISKLILIYLNSDSWQKCCASEGMQSPASALILKTKKYLCLIKK